MLGVAALQVAPLRSDATFLVDVAVAPLFFKKSGKNGSGATFLGSASRYSLLATPGGPTTQVIENSNKTCTVG